LPPAAPLVTLRQSCVDAHRAGRRDEARRLYARYLAQSPDDASMWSNLGVLLRTEQKYDHALRAQERAMAHDADAPGIRNNYANILSDIGRYEDSISVREAVLRTAPDDLNQLAMIGRCLRGMGQYADAIAHLGTASARHPDDPELKVQLAFAQLADRRYADGFKTYDIRWQTDELTPRNMPYPKWAGEDVDGKTVLVLTEQGFGDSVLFARFLPHLKSLGAKVHFLCEKPLFRLFEGLDGVDWVGTALPKEVKVDYWTNIMDLPTIGLKVEADIPPPSRLTVPQESIDRANGIVAPYPGTFNVGVVWTGSATYKGNAFRSFSHTDFLPLSDIDGVQLFSLYKGPFLDPFVADGSSAFIIDAASTDRDFADCAATMQQMDLIVTSDTATAHIAGSLGLPVWTVLHWDPFWLYGHTEPVSPWYPSMRLFRQPSPRDWDGVFAQILPRLRVQVAKRKKGKR
jgi:Flp pilus assembly protein TadD